MIAVREQGLRVGSGIMVQGIRTGALAVPAVREVYRSMLPTAQALVDMRRSMLPTAQALVDMRRSMLPTAQALVDMRRSMLPTVQVLADRRDAIEVDLASALQAARELVITARSRAEVVDVLERLDDERRASAPLDDSLPASARLNRDQLVKLTTYLVVLDVLVIATVLRAHHPGAVGAVADVTSWAMVVLTLGQMLWNRR